MKNEGAIEGPSHAASSPFHPPTREKDFWHIASETAHSIIWLNPWILTHKAKQALGNKEAAQTLWDRQG